MSICIKIFTEGRFQPRRSWPPILHLSFTEFHLWSVRLWCRRHGPHGRTKFPRYLKRKYISKRIDIRDLLEKADRKLFKVRSVDPDCPLSKIIPKKKEAKYNLRK